MTFLSVDNACADGFGTICGILSKSKASCIIGTSTHGLGKPNNIPNESSHLPSRVSMENLDRKSINSASRS